MLKKPEGARPLLLVLLCVSMACSDDEPAGGADGTDAALLDLGTDAGLSDLGTDAAPSDASVDLGVSLDGGPLEVGGAPDLGPSDASPASPREVRLCARAAAAYARLCTDDGNRTCHVAAYASYCRSASEPGAAAEALDCLRNESTSGSCRTFSDPSGAAECVEAVLGTVGGSAWAQLAEAYRALCGGAQSTPYQFEPPFALLSREQLGQVSSCVFSASNCTSAEVCLLEGPQAAIAACYR